MSLKSWWEVTTPHKDIREGQMNEAIFAADLGDVVNGKAPLEYQDPIIFFQKTYPTEGLKNLLENVHLRLSEGKGDSVIQLQTPFGGGKTHALLMLYHVIKNRDKLEHLDFVSKLPKIKNARVVVFVGTQADPLKGRTPWGEIAYQLGVYDKVKEHDEKRRSPGKEIISEILGEDPVLILIDELVEYAVKAKDFADQISVFSQELTDVVKSKNKCSLVCTLPSSAPYGEAGERALNELQRIFGRVEKIYTPVEGVEIYEVIRKRLFEDIGDEKIRKKVAQSYFDMYQKLGGEVPSEVKEIEYRDRIEHAYPFHPELIDLLYEHWGSIPTFQRTRGVLRLLGEVVADLYKRKVVSPLIQSSLVNLENPAIRRELIKHIGNEYDSVISADIAGKNAKAPRIDKEIGSEYEKYGIASGIATCVFLYSFSGSERKEISLPRIRVALLREGIPYTIVGDAIAKLEEELWYFHSEKNQYAFRNRPNLNRVLVDKEETINEKTILEELKGIIQKIAGRSLEVYLWPESSSDIPDNKNLKLAILDPKFSYNQEYGKKLVSELFEKAGLAFRVYKNTLFIIATDENQYFNILKSMKRLMALKEIQNDRKILDTLTKESQDELKKKLKDVEDELPFKILTAYRYLVFFEERGLEWKDLGIPTVGTKLDISERVKNYLKDQEKILPKLTSKYIIEKAFAKNEEEKEFNSIYELFLKTPEMPILENENVLLEAIKEGVKAGIIGIKKGEEIYYQEDIIPTIDSIVLRGDIANKMKENKKTTVDKVKVEGTDIETQPKIEAPPKKETKSVKGLTIKAKIPWDQLSSIISGVIGPLKEKGKSNDQPEIIIEIKAESEEGYDRNTLDNKIKETLKQIGAEIIDWKEE